MKYAKQIITLLALTLVTVSYGQDGEGLFKSKCNTCHVLGKNSTGPDLKGVKAKWDDAGEGDLLYEWVKNPQALILSGKSKVAMETKNYSPTDMTPQPVSNEEIDAILSFVDGWVPPPAKTETPSGDPIITYVPNYKRNLTMFYFLLGLLIVQIIGILTLGGSMKTIVKLELRKRAGNAKTVLMLLGAFGLMALNNTSYALSFMEAGAAAEGQPWLVVEDSDIIFFVAVNVLATCVLLYMRKSFMTIMREIRPEGFVKRKKENARSINAVLTDVVPIEEEHTILMHHEYDGIRELDNNLPPWWVWGFYFTIGFGIVYLLNYHVFKGSDLQYDAYYKEMAKAKIEVAEYLDKMAMNVDENSATLMTEQSDLSEGKAIFNVNCASCHLADGSGETGPNLTDKNWIYGYDIGTVFGTISKGTGRKGMPAHNGKLNPIQIQQVASYVLSMPEVKGNRGPDGEIVEGEE